MNATRLNLAMLLMLGGCPRGAEPIQPPPPAVVSSFTATPKLLTTPGEMVTLAWETKDATRVSIEQVGKGQLNIDGAAASGTTQVAVSAGATFVLTAVGEGGTDSAVQSVAFEGVTGSAQFEALPRQIDPGQTTTLVWNVPGAQSVTITPAGGAALDLRGQTSTGSVVVAPAASTRYTLTAGTLSATVDVEVTPVIVSFEAGPSPAPGQPLTLSWQTLGGARLTLTRAGASMPLLVEMDAVQLARGSFQDTAPNLPTDGIVTYRLEVEQGMLKAERIVTVRIGGDLRLEGFRAPEYVRSDLPFGVSWSTRGATSVELQVDGSTVYVAPSAALAAAGNTVLPPLGAASSQLRIVVRNDRGGLVTATRTVNAVGLPVVNSFMADQSAVTNGGEAVVLSWNVANARIVRITQTGGGIVHSASGTLDTGSVTVYPNRASSVYTLTASNGAGDAIAPQTVTVTVANVARLTFERLLPQGATGRVTGHTVVGGAEVWGLPSAEERPGEAFVDIVGAGGASIGYTGPDTQAARVTLPEAFSTVIYGRRVTSSSLSVSINGWFMFSGAAVAGPDNNSALPGTALEPLAIAPYWDDLYDIGPSEIYYRLDDVAGQRRLIVQWQDVEHDDYPGSVLTFQAQVYASGKIVFAYRTLQGVTMIDPTVGVVSSTELDAVVAPSAPAAGKTFTFFGSPATLPLPLRLESQPYHARVSIGPGFVDVEGDGRIPAGAFALTEANPRPAAGLTNAEWLEVTNFTSVAIDLQGWTINFGGMNTHVIATPVILPANGHVLLAQSLDLGDPTAMLTASYVYPAALAMADTSGSVTLDLVGLPYTRIAWDSTSVPAPGVSARAITAPTVGTLLGAPACPSTGTYGVQTGTPGTASPPCIPYAMTELPAASFESLAGPDAGTKISVGAADEDVYTVVLPVPIRYYGANVSTLYVSTNGWITTTSTTSAGLSNKSTPSTSAPIGSIAPFWDDHEAGTFGTSGMYWAQRDPDSVPMTGDEYTVVSWEGWQPYLNDGEDLNFQVKFMANGDIEYHYAAMSGTSGRNRGSSATSWFEDRNGRTAFAINVNSLSPGIAPFTAYRVTYVP